MTPFNRERIEPRVQDTIIACAGEVKIQVRDISAYLVAGTAKLPEMLFWKTLVVEPGATLTTIGGNIPIEKDTTEESFMIILKRNTSFMLTAAMLPAGKAIMQAVLAHGYFPQNLAVATFIHACVIEYERQANIKGFEVSKTWGAPKMIGFITAKLREGATPILKDLRNQMIDKLRA